VIKKYILGWLLHLANRDVGIFYKEQFYAIKKKLLLKYGTYLGEEIQHIRKECYSCDSTGIFKCDWKLSETCFNCRGTGVYEQYWTRLDKYKLGRYTFHNPTKRQYEYEPLFEKIELPLIIGYIHHKSPKYRMGTEAKLWLFLIYDYAIFKKMTNGHIGYKGNIKTPLVFITALNFNIKHEWTFKIWSKEDGWFWQKEKEPEWKTERAFNDDHELPF
jgi:hypothetical protein